MCHGSGDLGATTVGALGSGPFSGDGGGGGDGGTYCYLGTSGWVATTCAAAGRRRAAPRAFRLRHPSPATSTLAAPMTTAGGNLRWLAALLFGEATPVAQACSATTRPPSDLTLTLTLTLTFTLTLTLTLSRPSPPSTPRRQPHRLAAAASSSCPT